MHRPARPRPPLGTVFRGNARSATIRRLILRITAERGGVAPSDAELAGILATSESRVRKHRSLLGL